VFVVPEAPPPWDPGYVATYVSITDDEAMAQREDSLKSQAKQFGLTDPPDVTLIRWTSRLDWGATIAKCLQDAGFNVVGSGAMMYAPDGIGPAQASAYYLADYTCNAEYSMNPRYKQTYTASQWGMQYDYYVQWFVPCMASFGVVASTPPTRDTFIAQGLQSGTPAWGPWSEGQRVYSERSWEEYSAFLTTCPADPPVEYMWGS